MQGVVRRRNMTWPTGRVSLQIPLLARAEFTKRIDCWLRKLVIAFKPILVPFHLPSSKYERLDFLRAKTFCTLCVFGMTLFKSMEELRCHVAANSLSICCRLCDLSMDIWLLALKCYKQFILRCAT